MNGLSFNKKQRDQRGAWRLARLPDAGAQRIDRQ
jgi:hypothetical protein